MNEITAEMLLTSIIDTAIGGTVWSQEQSFDLFWAMAWGEYDYGTVRLDGAGLDAEVWNAVSDRLDDAVLAARPQFEAACREARSHPSWPIS